MILALSSVSYAFWGKKDGEGRRDRKEMGERKERREKREKPKMSKEERHKFFMDKMAEDLGLNETQKVEIDKIMKDGWERMMAEKKIFHEKMEALKSEKDSEIMNILDETQKVKFQEKIKEREEKFKNRPKMDEKCKDMEDCDMPERGKMPMED